MELAEFRLRSCPGVLYNLHPRQSALTDGWKPPDQERPNRSQCNNIELRLDRTPGHQDTRTRAGRKFNRPHLGRRGRLPYVRRIKRRREHANEIPPTPIPLQPRPAVGQREVRFLSAGDGSDGSRRVFHAVPQDRNHLNKSRKRECGQQKPEAPLYRNHILRGVPREKARREPVVPAPPAASGCLTAVRLPRRCLLLRSAKAASRHCAAFAPNPVTARQSTHSSLVTIP